MERENDETQACVITPASNSSAFLASAISQARLPHSAEGFTDDRRTGKLGTSLNAAAHALSDESFNGFDLFLTNPPFGAYFDAEEAGRACPLKTTKTELIFLYISITLLRRGGRLSTIIPEGILFGGSKAHQQLRTEMLEHNGLDALVSIPAGVFKPNTGVSTVLLLLTKGKPTERVWFAEMKAHGFSLDNKRRPVLQNDIPDILEKWAAGKADASGDRTGKYFFVPISEIRACANNLHAGRHRQAEVENTEHRSPRELILEMIELESQISADLNDLLQMTLEC